jgi:hypothetical protein
VGINRRTCCHLVAWSLAFAASSKADDGRMDAPVVHAAPSADSDFPQEERAYPAAQVPESLSIRFYGKVYLLPSEDSPLIGIAEDGGRLPIFRRKGDWTQIGFHNGTGWVFDPAGTRSAAPRESTVTAGLSYLRIAQISFLFCGGLGLALVAVASGLWLRRRLAVRVRGRQGPLPDRDRLVVLLAGREKIIESGIAGVFISLDKCFRDIGFTVVSTRNVAQCGKLLSGSAPVILGIDGQLSPKVYGQVYALCRGAGKVPSVVFFYNAPHPERIRPPAELPHALYLGTSFTSRHVMEIVAPAFKAEPETAAPAGSGREICSLEGKIVANGLAEILQFLEVGRRTGMLSVEEGQPAGVVNFVDGVITFAQTRIFEGPDAVLEILSLSEGSFHFFADKRVRQSNCRLSAFEVLLQWAHRLDETGKFPAYTER